MTHIKMGFNNFQVRCCQPVAKQFLRYLTYSLKLKFKKRCSSYPTLSCQHCDAISHRLNCEGGGSYMVCYPKIDICMCLVWIARLVWIAKLGEFFQV